MQVNKKRWILVKQRTFTTNIKAEITCFKKKTFTMKKRKLFFFYKIFSLARAKISLE